MPRQRTYSEAEKLGAMLRGLETSPRQACDELDVPRQTLYGWYADAGGIGQIKTVAALQVVSASSQASVAIARSVQTHAEANTLPPKDLLETFRSIIRPVATTSRSEAPAQAQAVIQVTVQGAAGPEVIEVPRDRPALAEPEQEASDE